MTDHKRLVRHLMKSNRAPIHCTRALAGTRPVLLFQIDNMHVLADHVHDQIKPVLAFENKQDIYQYCAAAHEPIVEYD